MRRADDEIENDRPSLMVLKSFAEGRCYACGWTFSDTGCRPFDCSYRPTERNPEYEGWLQREHEMQNLRAEVLAAAKADAKMQAK